MTAGEKREAKLNEKKFKKRRKLKVTEDAGCDIVGNGTRKHGIKDENRNLGGESPETQPASCPYLNFPVDRERLAEELADLRGERDGVPPVVLPPPLCQLLLAPGTGDLLPHFQTTVPDDELARRWATTLKESMVAAEETRHTEEGLRPLPYHLVPEVWKRMRPLPIGVALAKNKVAKDEAILPHESRSWAFCQIRPPTPEFDSDAAAIIQLLHNGTNLHLACGAKFGCDYLIYDGPRQDRHAFAGLRILPTRQRDVLPTPTAYDLSGYVRCLNTAGKLALLATVVRDHQGSNQVAIVDLALVKIADTTSSRPRKSMEQRFQNLAKK